jgi:hypothetical protein
VEYKLSELGPSLLPVVDHARLWGRAHLGGLDGNRPGHDQAGQTGKPGSDAAITGFQPPAGTRENH